MNGWSLCQEGAAILSTVPLDPHPDPDEASATVMIDGITFCASILPWAGCAKAPLSPWAGSSLEDMARKSIDRLTDVLPPSNTVWGGDWNQNLACGWQNVGSSGMRRLIESAVSSLGLQVVTAELPHQAGAGHYTIDHIAVPAQWAVLSAKTISGLGLSDHDAHIIEVSK